MSELSPEEKHRFDSAGDAVGEVSDADRRFFERFPHRTYRLRRMSFAEKEQGVALTRRPWHAKSVRVALFTLVKQLEVGARMRIFIPGPPDEDGSDVPDEVCAELWEDHAQRHPEQAQWEAKARAALARRHR